MGAARGLYAIRLLRIVLGAFFIYLGFLGINTSVNESFFSLNNVGLEMIFGVIEIICGALLLLGFFSLKSRNAVYWGGLIVFLFWLARIVLSKVIWGMSFTPKGVLFHPDIYSWLLAVLTELAIAAAIFVVVQRYD